MNRRRIPLFIIAIVLAGLGACAFVFQQMEGLGITGLNEPVVWGSYVVNFTFCLGLGAGILMCLGVRSLWKQDAAIQRLYASLIAFLCLGLAGVFIMVDLGRIDRFYYMIIYAQPTSHLFWDFVALQILLGLATFMCFTGFRQVYLSQGLRDDAGRLERLLYKVTTFRRNVQASHAIQVAAGIVMLFFTLAVYLVSTKVFVSSKTHPQWNSPGFMLLFVVATVLSGLAVVLLVTRDSQSVNTDGDAPTALPPALRRLVLLLIIDLAVILVKLWMDHTNPLVQRVYSLFPFSLPLFLIIGNGIPLVLVYIYRRQTVVLHYIVPVFVLVGILLKRAEMIIPVYFNRWLPFEPDASYVPTLPELLLIGGVYAAAFAIVTVVFSWIATRLVKRTGEELI